MSSVSDEYSLSLDERQRILDVTLDVKPLVSISLSFGEQGLNELRFRYCEKIVMSYTTGMACGDSHCKLTFCISQKGKAKDWQIEKLLPYAGYNFQ